MTYFEWESLPEAERIERCAKALRWHKLGAFWVDQANNVMADLERKGEWDGWDPLRSRDDCQALIEAVAALRDSAKQMRFGQSIIRLYTLVDPDLLAWAACKALEGHD